MLIFIEKIAQFLVHFAEKSALLILHIFAKSAVTENFGGIDFVKPTIRFGTLDFSDSLRLGTFGKMLLGRFMEWSGIALLPKFCPGILTLFEIG